MALLVHVGWVHAGWLKIEDMGKVDTIQIWMDTTVCPVIAHGVKIDYMSIQPYKIDSLHVFIRPQVGLDLYDVNNPANSRTKAVGLILDTACWHWETQRIEWNGDLRDIRPGDIASFDNKYLIHWFKVYNDCDNLKNGGVK